MDVNVNASYQKGPSINPWLLILITALAPLGLSMIFFFKWYQDKTDFKRIQSQFVQRQNTVMAYDAMEVSTGFSDLLEKAGRDVQVLGMLPPTQEAFLRFYQSQFGDYTRYDPKNKAVIQEPLSFYNRISYLTSKGDLVFEVDEGKFAKVSRPLSQCLEKDLCDRALLEAAVKLPVGEIYYGKMLRYYAKQAETEDYRGAGISVAYKGSNGIFLITIDYRHLRDHLTSPSFPYDPKTDLLDAYQKGNYLYIVDNDFSIITHPKHSNAVGIDKKTGVWVSHMKEDADAGSHPINIRDYQKGLLKEYFARLMSYSFKQKGVDIFEAPNLLGTKRILSVAPIFVSKGQYKESGIFGHVIVACNVDFFEAPKQAIVPYY